MTLNFDIITGSNASWGFDGFSMIPESQQQTATTVTAPSVSFSTNYGNPAEVLLASTLQAPPPRAMSGSLQNIGGPAAQSASDYEENISPMKNDALNVSLQASDPAARSFDSNLYVASLPDWFTDADLYELFKRFGPILSAKVMCHKGTHHCKGYGFVLFQRTDDAAAARSEMIGHVVGGNKIQVRRARSAASAPLGEPAPVMSSSAFVEQPRSLLQSPSNVASLNVAPHLVPTSPQPFQQHSLYQTTPTFVVTNGSGSTATAVQSTTRSSAPTMLVAFPNNRTVMQGSDNVVYMVLTPSQMQTSNVIF